MEREANPEWEPYSRSVFRVPLFLDVYANNEDEAFRRVNRVVHNLADREDLALAQIGHRMKEAREQIAGATVFIDQLRKVVGPANPYPMPSIAELLDAATPPERRPPAGSLQLPGMENASEEKGDAR